MIDFFLQSITYPELMFAERRQGQKLPVLYDFLNWEFLPLFSFE